MESKRLSQQLNAPRRGYGGIESMRKNIRKLSFLVVFASWGFQAPAGYASEDEWLGLPEGNGREEVFYSCQACHSLMTVTQQGLNRESWKETLVWMIEEQGMAEPDEEEWGPILDYLSTFYGRDRKAKNMAAGD